MEYNAVDGIVIDERAPSPALAGVGNNIALLIGDFSKGPKNEIVEPGSHQRIIEMFGDDSEGYNALRSKRFSRLQIIRVPRVDAVAASVILSTSGGVQVMRITAKEAGVVGNAYQAIVSATTAHGGEATAFELEIRHGATTETYDEITAQAVVDAINADADSLVTAELLQEGRPANSTGHDPLTGGTDSSVTDNHYLEAIKTAEAENAGQIIFADKYNSAINAALSEHVALTQDKVAILAGPEEQTVTEFVADVASYRNADGRLIYAYNWASILINGVDTFVQPASFVASILSNIGAHIDPAAFQTTGLLFGITGLKQNLSRADYIRIKEAGGAAFERDPDIGFKLKSGITTQIADPSKVTIVRRRMSDYLTNSIGRFLKIYQNAVNNNANRIAAKAAIMTFIRGQVALGILPGDDEVAEGSASIVDVETLNTDAAIAAGNFFINYRQRIFSSARFIVLRAEIGESVVVTEGDV